MVKLVVAILVVLVVCVNGLHLNLGLAKLDITPRAEYNEMMFVDDYDKSEKAIADKKKEEDKPSTLVKIIQALVGDK